MGAFGDTFCRYCDARFHEEGRHECLVDDLKIKIVDQDDALMEIRALVRPIVQNASRILEEANP